MEISLVAGEECEMKRRELVKEGRSSCSLLDERSE
jgi:hypothetical protein